MPSRLAWGFVGAIALAILLVAVIQIVLGMSNPGAVTIRRIF